MSRTAHAVLIAAALATAAAHAEPECKAPEGSVRVMLHEPALLEARFARLTRAGESHEARASATRELFEAAGCPRIVERGDGERRNVECVVPGAGAGEIVVGASQGFDTISTLALIPSLMEAIAAAPRAHSYRWVAFSAHAGGATRGEPRPKGAMRLLESATESERSTLRAMIHLGPIGFGKSYTHPAGADRRLECAFEAAAAATRLDLGPPDPSGLSAGACDSDFAFRRTSRGSDLVTLDCPAPLWIGGNDWLPFRRAAIPVFGVHSRPETEIAVPLDAKLYVKSYRALAIFLALADDALASPASPGATSPR